MNSPMVTVDLLSCRESAGSGALPAEPTAEPTDSSGQAIEILGHSNGRVSQLGHCGPPRRLQTGSRLQLAGAQRERTAGTSAPRLGTLDDSPEILVPDWTRQRLM